MSCQNGPCRCGRRLGDEPCHAAHLPGFGVNGDGFLLNPSIQSPELIVIELCFWALIALADGFAISAIVERGSRLALFEGGHLFFIQDPKAVESIGAFLRGEDKD